MASALSLHSIIPCASDLGEPTLAFVQNKVRDLPVDPPNGTNTQFHNLTVGELIVTFVEIRATWKLRMHEMNVYKIGSTVRSRCGA